MRKTFKSDYLKQNLKLRATQGRPIQENIQLILMLTSPTLMDGFKQHGSKICHKLNMHLKFFEASASKTGEVLMIWYFYYRTNSSALSRERRQRERFDNIFIA